ncbi:MAG: tRNA (N(6)-L-threonylcarbamoyladenosine(37)-C(2))-methylthiotransferase MtaB [Candidatus Eisenbacteria bacterium]|nr:tRNA (N(6)-L-threonylcarbamoyladenosine(37)-C(2))-methylthiotransferase MtaB [Candidatus Eisenbacteria bacterium]
MDAPFTFALGVLGCRANQEEIDALRSQLQSRGGRERPFPGPAELVILNSCAVTTAAQAQSRQALRRALRHKRGGCVAVTGCAAQLAPQELASLPGVDLVCGNREKSRLLDWWEAWRGQSGRAMPRTDSGAGAAIWRGEDPTLERFLTRASLLSQPRARALLKIQDGCSFRCSYCVVSRLRGSVVSRDPAEVVDAVQRLAAAGFGEVVLTGINLGLYRAPGATLADLLRRLAALPGRFRIRLSSLEPMTVTPELIAAVARSPRVCPHLHLAIQSGDDAVLAHMGRPYDRDDLRVLCARIHDALPDCGLGADLIAGFPGEDAAAFERTRALPDELGLTYLHPFAYSERPGTPGATLPGRLPERVRKERVAALRALDARLRAGFAERMRARRLEALIETVDAGRFRGVAGEYLRLEGPADPACAPRGLRAVTGGSPVAGELHDCHLQAAADAHLQQGRG